MKVLGVDLGSFSIKIAELETSSKGYIFNNFFEIPLSLDPNRDRGLQIIEALREFSSRYNPADTKWVIGIPQHQLSVQFKRFPFRERSKIYKSLAFELEDEIPLEIDETVFDFKVIDYVGTSANTLTVACPKESVEEALQIAKDGGFETEIVSAEALAFANIFEVWNQAPPEASSEASAPPRDEMPAGERPPPRHARAILQLGHSHSLLLVYMGGALIAARSILWGGAEVAGSIATAFNVPIFEGIKTLTTRGFVLMNSAGATREQIKLSQSISSQIDNLIRDLKLPLLEIKSDFNLEYDEIELLGGLSQIQNLGAYLTQGLEIPANARLQSLADKPSRVQSTQHLEAVAGVALGLAIEAIKRPRNPAINLRRGEFERENVVLKKFWETWCVPVQIATGAFALFFVYSIIRDQISTSLNTGADERVTEAAQKVAGLKGNSANEDGVRRYIKTQKDRIKNQEALSQLDDYIPALEILSRLSEKFPPRQPAGQPGLDVVFLEVDNDDLTIKGRAANVAQSAQVQKALSEFARPKTITTIATPDVTGGTPFGFKMKINRKKQ